MKKTDMSTEKRLFLAVALSFVVLTAYPYFMAKILPAPPTEEVKIEKTETLKEATTTKENTSEVAREVAPATTNVATPLMETATPALGGTKKPFIEEWITIDTPLYRAEITTNGGGVNSFYLKNYKKEKDKGDELVNIVTPVTIKSSTKTAGEVTLSMSGFTDKVQFETEIKKVSLGREGTKSFTLKAQMENGLFVTKTFTFNGEDYFIETETVLTNNSGARLRGTLETMFVKSVDVDADPYFHKGALVYQDGDIDRIDFEDDNKSKDSLVKWLGVEDKYFLLAMLPTEATRLDKWTLSAPSEDSATATVSSLFDVNVGGRESFKLSTFIGPKEFSVLTARNVALEEAIEFGFLSFIAKPVLGALNYFYGYIGNYGIAIILLTVIIKVFFYPLTRYSFQSMKKMQSVQPQMKVLREKYKNDKQKMNLELMDLYKRYKINPLGGCLPMLLQIPVFIALYEALSVAIELRHAPFGLWIHDLSAADPYYITPLIMGASMFVQQRMTPSTLDPIQQKVMLAMPIVFTFVFLSFPSGLVIYWLVNNIITIAQMYHVYKTD